MTIGEVAAQVGLAPSAIRYYEKAGLLAPPTRSNGQRRYDSGVVSQLVIIRFAQDNGFTLTEIRLLLHGFPETTPASARWKKLASRKIAELGKAVAKARTMQAMLERLLSCRCRKLEQCAQGLARHLEKRPIAPGKGPRVS